MSKVKTSQSGLYLDSMPLNVAHRIITKTQKTGFNEDETYGEKKDFQKKIIRDEGVDTSFEDLILDLKTLNDDLDNINNVLEGNQLFQIPIKNITVITNTANKDILKINNKFKRIKKTYKNVFNDTKFDLNTVITELNETINNLNNYITEFEDDIKTKEENLSQNIEYPNYMGLEGLLNDLNDEGYENETASSENASSETTQYNYYKQKELINKDKPLLNTIKKLYNNVKKLIDDINNIIETNIATGGYVKHANYKQHIPIHNKLVNYDHMYAMEDPDQIVKSKTNYPFNMSYLNNPKKRFL